MAVGAGAWDGGLMTAGMAGEVEMVVVKGKGNETMRTEGLIATATTKSERGGATAVVKNESLLMILEILGDLIEERGAKIAIFGKKSGIF